MQWQDEGILLGARRHGETAVVASAFTRAHGRHAGLVHGGRSRRLRGVLQPGNRVSLVWRGRLADQLGAYTVEPLESAATPLLDRPGPLAALLSACAVTEAGFAERDAQPAFYADLLALVAALDTADWAAAYARWELAALTALGFGLDLRQCAVTGAADDLTHVSPRTGRAVRGDAVAKWVSRLLPLPGFLRREQAADAPVGPMPVGPMDVLDALRLTGFFLERRVFAPHDQTPPECRARLEDHLRRLSGA